MFHIGVPRRNTEVNVASSTNHESSSDSRKIISLTPPVRACKWTNSFRHACPFVNMRQSTLEIQFMRSNA